MQGERCDDSLNSCRFSTVSSMVRPFLARCKEVLVLLNYVHTIPIGAMPDWAMGVGVLFHVHDLAPLDTVKHHRP